MSSHVRFTMILTLVLGLLALTLPCAQAQSTVQAGFGGQLAFPQNEFAKQVDLGGGLGGEFLYSPAAGPFGIGLTVNYLIYGSETRREPFSTTIPDVEVDVTTENQIVLAHLLFRVQAKGGPIQPYADGLVGLNYLYTQTRIKSLDWVDDDDDDVASSTNFDDTAFSYGFGGGVMVRVWQGEANSESDNPQKLQVFVDLRGHYMRGGEAEYLKKGSIRRVNGKVLYDISKSTTDLLLFKIGATVAF